MKPFLLNKRLWAVGVGIVMLLLAGMQLAPIEKSNPPVIAEPNWDSPETRDLVKTACYDCHSNESVYPWYADVGPTRILVRQHVLEGRDHLNFSEYNRRLNVREIREVIEEGEMPPWDYLLLHPEARLSDAEKEALINGLVATAANQ
jgi:hypothetical protein